MKRLPFGKRGDRPSIVEHSNAAEARAVLDLLPHLTDDELRRLAARWTNTWSMSDARARVLSPDTPFAVDILGAFTLVDDLCANTPYDGESDGPTFRQVTRLAGMTIRDAITAAIARPALSRYEYGRLAEPWLEVFGPPPGRALSYGEHTDRVVNLLTTMQGLVASCHDPDAAALTERLATVATALPSDACNDAWSMARAATVLSGRRWIRAYVESLVGAGGVTNCLRCGRVTQTWDDRRARRLVAETVCALSVADLTGEDLTSMAAPLWEALAT